jgi:hypothetical protein
MILRHVLRRHDPNRRDSAVMIDIVVMIIECRRENSISYTSKIVAVTFSSIYEILRR